MRDEDGADLLFRTHEDDGHGLAVGVALFGLGKLSSRQLADRIGRVGQQQLAPEGQQAALIPALARAAPELDVPAAVRDDAYDTARNDVEAGEALGEQDEDDEAEPSSPPGGLSASARP